jgi:hypothetical protein
MAEQPHPLNGDRSRRCISRPHGRDSGRPDREPGKGWAWELSATGPRAPTRGSAARAPREPQVLSDTSGHDREPTIFWDATGVRDQLVPLHQRASVLIQMGVWCGQRAATDAREDPGCV